MNGRTGWAGGLTAVAVLAVLAGRAPGQAKAPAALVNGEAIGVAEVDAILRNRPPSATPLTEAQQRQARREALDLLINDVVMKQFLRRQHTAKDHLQPASPEVGQKVGELAAALKKQGSSLAQFLKETGQTETQLRANIIKDLRWEAYLGERLSDADVQRYYADYKPFFDKVTVRASHILYRLPANATPAEKAAARAKLQALRQDIVAGKVDFADAARKYSDCPSGKENGGDLGFFPRKFVVLEPFARAAFALKIGEVSEVVETEAGLHLIKATAQTPGEPSDFTKIKDEVRRICMMEMGMGILDREHKAAKVEIKLP